jgi:hypothetical protein
MTRRFRDYPDTSEVLIGQWFNSHSNQQLPEVQAPFPAPRIFRAFYEEKTLQPKDKHHWTGFEHYVKSVSLDFSPFPVPSATWSVWDDDQAGHVFGHTDPSYAWKESVFGDVDDPTLDLPPLYLVSGTGFIPAPNSWPSLIAASLMNMLPQIRPKVSSLNSLYELKDFKTLPATLRNARKAVKSLQLLIKRFGGKNDLTLRRLLHASADVNLQTQFNILPLIRDISDTFSAVSSVRKQVNKLLSQETKLNRRHYVKDLGSLYPYKDDSVGNIVFADHLSGGAVRSPNIRATFEHRRTVQTKSSFHATIEYSYYLTQFDREHALLLGLLDYFGVNLNPQIIWNAVKWSFVVDWVFSVGKWLSQFKVSNLEPVTVIHDYCASIRTEREINCYNTGSTSLASMGTRHVSTVRETSYRRDEGIPDLYAPLESSGISLSEFILSTSLLLTRLRH